jgi:hypothetical protein
MEMRGRRGYFFSIVAIFMIILFISMIAARDKFRYTEKSLVVSNRVHTINNFIRDFESDLDREMYIGGFRTFLSIHRYMRQSEDFLDDVDQTFFEMFVNGTYNGTIIELLREEGVSSDLMSWKDRVNEEAAKMNIRVDIAPRSLELVQVTPWIIRANLHMDVNVSDIRGLAMWTFNKTYSHDFEIEGFEDPLYTIYTEGKITYLVNRTRFTSFVHPVTNSTYNLSYHINETMYRESGTAPSYLMRFEGNLSNSTVGIESIVDFLQFNKQNIPVRNKTQVDYLYFNTASHPPEYCNIQNMPYWFRIDQDHAAAYGIDTLEKENC